MDQLLEKQAQVRLVINVVYDESGGLNAQELADGLQRNVESAIGNGLLTGDTAATVETWGTNCHGAVTVCNEVERGEEEDRITAWLTGRIESSDLSLEDIPRLMARYALAEPAEMRLELNERMAGSPDLSLETPGTTKMACTAFQISEDDIEQVLHEHGLRVVNSHGKSFEAMAGELFSELDHERVEKAALDSGCDIDTQTAGALVEIKTMLVEMGVLEF
jgi:hypothetical protein